MSFFDFVRNLCFYDRFSLKNFGSLYHIINVKACFKKEIGASASVRNMCFYGRHPISQDGIALNIKLCLHQILHLHSFDGAIYFAKKNLFFLLSFLKANKLLLFIYFLLQIISI